MENIKEYKGYKFEATIIDEKEFDEGCSIPVYRFEAIKNGERIHFDWSSYSPVTQQDFNRWIDLGCPDRHHEALELHREVIGYNVYSPINNSHLNVIERWQKTGMV